MLLVSGCGASLAEARPRTVEPQRQARELREERERHEARERELSGRLALAEATARDLRSELYEIRRAPIRIGGDAHEEPIAAETSDGARRPVLRLYGVPEDVPMTTSAFDAGAQYEPSGAEPLDPIVPALASALGPLPTTGPPPANATFVPLSPMPTGPSVQEPRPTRASSGDAVAAAYRRALGMLRDRRYADAAHDFAAFVAAHPESRHAPSALYWRAEAMYALRDYRAAARAFEAFLAQSHGHEREADALLKLSLCHRNVGDARSADAVVRRLSAEHPNSVAARLASRGR